MLKAANVTPLTLELFNDETITLKSALESQIKEKIPIKTPRTMPKSPKKLLSNTAETSEERRGVIEIFKGNFSTFNSTLLTFFASLKEII